MAAMTRAGLAPPLASAGALLPALACSRPPAPPSGAGADSASAARATPGLTTGTPPASPTEVALESTPFTASPLKIDPKSVDLTGAWAGDDGGIFYVEQVGKIVWWNELSGRDGPA